jgi:hypothetical protein
MSRKLLNFLRFAILVIIIGMAPVLQVFACEVPVLVCGNLEQGEFTSSSLEKSFIIDLYAQDIIELQLQPTAGVGIVASIELIGPARNIVATSKPGSFDSAIIEPTTLPNDGQYIIRVVTTGNWGQFTLQVHCVVDGVYIGPGSVPSTAELRSLPSCGEPTVTPASASSAMSVTVPDISAIPLIPLFSGSATNGSFVDADSNATVYSLEVNEDSTLDLSIERVAGNLNIGVAVLSPEQNLIFLGTLIPFGIEQPSLNSRFILPTTDTYKIVVFNMNMMPPTSPEPTVFTLTITVEPTTS